MTDAQEDAIFVRHGIAPASIFMDGQKWWNYYPGDDPPAMGIDGYFTAPMLRAFADIVDAQAVELLSIPCPALDPALNLGGGI